MTSVVMCACGIAKDDCDYHKPPPESKPATLRYVVDDEIPTARYVTGDGTWYQVIVDKDEKLEALMKIAEQIGAYHGAQVSKALENAYKETA